MEKKELRLLGAIAVILTLLMFAYTMTAALNGNRSSKPQAQASTAQSSTNNQSSSNTAQQTGEPLDPVTEKLFPAKVSEMNRIELIAGEQALKSVSMLHGKDIPLKQAYVANYQGQGNKKMTIWYSETNNLQDAQLLFQAMDQKMPNSDAFKDYKTIKLKDQEYKFITGMGQEHYYWLKGNRVLWIAVQGSDSLKVLKEIIPLY
ncbi:hypothetical protein [Desulfitobacterium sp.]|uniref:hypothetical protein n=1 Tax=Desulfitobacterium sp. TaxID=49981 RepID=UPI002BB508B5|nr:hypothetical protein [Desulfitobacterium sp.]HVJ47682.1 hypothetical protein [Desulfitobacterium sp.]